MTLDEAYKIYGQLAIQAEIINNKTQEIKQFIANEMNKPSPEKDTTKKKE